MEERAEITNWVASSIKFLRKCNPDLRTAALSLLYSRIIFDGVFKDPSMDPAKQKEAETELAKSFINTMAEFVSNGRERWRKKPEV